MTKQELFNRIKADGKERDIIGGAIGDLKGCYAYRESEQITKNGWETKYYGIATPYKGKVDKEIIDKATITKRAFREIVMCWPLNFKRIIPALNSIYTCEGGLKSNELGSKEFCPFCRELVRTGWKVIEDKINLVYAIAMFLQFSPTWRLYAQDALGELDKEYFLKHPLTEILRLKRIVRYRAYSEGKKIEQFGWLIFLWVLFNKKLARKIVKELDIDKVKLDDQDWYYCLRRESYNFKGRDLYSRLVEAEQIDARDNNLTNLPIEKGLWFE